jgi:ATP-dependent DNA helicase RecG
MYLKDFNLSIRRLKGIGSHLTELFAKMGVYTSLDLIFLSPRRYEDRTRLVGVKEAATQNKPALTTCRVLSQEWFGNHRPTLKIRFSDHLNQEGTLLCFNREYLKDMFPVGAFFHLYGNFQFQYQEFQSSQFEISKVTHEKPKPPGFGSILPIYPSTAGLKQASIRKAVQQALGFLSEITDELPLEIKTKFNLTSWKEALDQIHQPSAFENINQARSQLAFRELWFLIGNTLLERQKRLSFLLEKPYYSLNLMNRVIDSLPYKLTEGQQKSLQEILNDLQSGRCMARLLQGDVGAGKTLVAVLSALPLIEAENQVAFLAPTEILAQQHFQNFSKLLGSIGIKISLLTSSTPTGERQAILNEIKEGSISLIVGTHSLLSKEIIWKKLRYVIVDEQHRFGVEQREQLLKDGDPKHLLMMSATPIPRSLALTVFGDLDVTSLPDLPAGRTPITTYLVTTDHIERVWKFLQEKLDQGQQAYIVVPIIDESEKRNLNDLNTVFSTLKSVFPNQKIGVVHGRLKDAEKSIVMVEFNQGKIQILCATSVVEVGVDVANATCMVIYHAEVFGLSALHQLRGRVGRGSLPGFCFLVYSPNLTEEAKTRLKIMRSTTNGFELAEMDLKLRGPGEFLGVRQAGNVKLNFANWEKDSHLILKIRDEILNLFEKDPHGEWITHLRMGSFLRSSVEESN